MLDTAPGHEMLEACRSGDANRVAQLLEWGVDPSRVVQGAAPFMTEACMAGHLDVVKVLVRHGVVPTERDLIAAIESGNVYLVDRVGDELFYAGIEYDLWTEDRPLLCKPGFLQSTSARMVEWMLEHGADASEADRFGRTAAKLAEADGVDPEIRALLAR